MKLRVTIAQQNYLLGDIEGNAQKIIDAIQTAQQQNADLIVFPELAVTGYPPEDLLFRQELHDRVTKALHTIAKATTTITAIVGYPAQIDDRLYNCAGVFSEGQLQQHYFKHHLPNYSVFDEKRYFSAGDQACVINVKQHAIGLLICEDIWQPGPLAQSHAAGAQMVVCLNASPYHMEKQALRLQTIRQQQQNQAAIPVIYVNHVGGQDELIFDGHSMVLDKEGQVVQSLEPFKSVIETIDFDPQQLAAKKLTKEWHPVASCYQALVLATQDYLSKNRFPGALVGLSGGIDSALTYVIACDAIGADNVHAVLMPSRFTANISIEDAKACVANMAGHYSEIPIEPTVQAFETSLAPAFKGLARDVTEENIQARCRGIILMALSNKHGQLVLATGNKSEMAVGYSTLYGDMVGGFAVLKDVPKTLVYQLADYRNQLGQAIPKRIIERAPSAELAENQTDQDSLPPYSILDQIIDGYVEHNQSIESLIQQGLPADMVKLTVNLIDKNEYKRRQAAPGIRISPRAFGRDWRYPITSGFGRR